MAARKIIPWAGLTVSAFESGFGLLLPGEALIYHVGSLSEDRLHDPVVNGVAKAALALCDRGEALLLQRRLGALHYEYRIVKSQHAAGRRGRGIAA